MTREQARKIVFEKMKCYEGKECQQFIDVVEALGLIKFDEESSVYQVIRNYVAPDNLAAAVENALRTKGFLKCP